MTHPSQSAAVTWQFSEQDQLWFANFSGDFNPIHVDSVQARRTLFGTQVVHGIHLVIGALNSICQNMTGLRKIVRLDTQFIAPVLIGDTVQLFVQDMSGDHEDQISWITNHGRNCAKMKVSFEQDTRQSINLPISVEKLVCHEASEEDYLHGGGSLPLFLNGAELSEKYPDLARVVCPLQIAQIIATSRLVGMQLPGLHSLYNGLSVEFSQSEPDAPSELTYQTLRYLPRYKRLKLSLASAGLTGTLEASVRPTPITQPKMAHITNLVQSKAWKSKRAIVIGGSRGLGEAAAKILAAAGAEVLITYLAGENDANAVAEDIRSAGGCAEVLRYDVLKPNEPDFKKLAAFGPDLVCYFATPKILLNTSGFSESKHDFYAQYFVTGMWNLVTGFLGANTGPFRLFNPSTNYIDNVVPGALEYAMAKADSEVLCNYMAEEFNNVSCCSRRLPPIKTDQSVSLLHKEVGDAVSELLPILLGDARSV